MSTSSRLYWVHYAARGAVRSAISLLLLLTLGNCTESTEQEQALVDLEVEVSKGVSQYVTLMCGCFGVQGDDTWQALCQQEQALRFPISDCDAELLRLDEALGSDFLFCLQRDVNRASACLIGCDTTLIRQCQGAFLSVDTLDCQSALSDEQLEMLLTCSRIRADERQALIQSNR